jgi:predicted GIY-YIG superfamily endonuclease
MHWVYILRCEDNYYYVGETSRLYRRFWEHQGGIGGLNTSTYSPEEIVAIYKVNTICKFMDYNEYVSKILDGVWYENYKCFKLRDFNDENEEEHYDNLCAENNIAECLMTHKKNEWNKIRGGKYTRFDIEYKYPDNNYIKDLPLCKCGLPCDVRKNEDKNYLYFRMSR